MKVVKVLEEEPVKITDVMLEEPWTAELEAEDLPKSLECKLDGGGIAEVGRDGEVERSGGAGRCSRYRGHRPPRKGDGGCSEDGEEMPFVREE